MDVIVSALTCDGTIAPWGLVVVCVGLFIAGLVDSIAGGGGLISTPAFLIAGLPLHSVIATNKLANSMGTAVSCFKYWRAGFMKWKLCLPCIIAALCASSAGANVSLITNENTLRIMMLVVIPIAGFYVLRSHSFGNSKPYNKPAKTYAACIVCALGIGFYDGLYGPGTGTFLLLALSGFGKLNMQDAAGTTKAINITTNVTALAVFLVNGAVMIPLGLLSGCFNIAGNYLGATLFTTKGTRAVRPLIVVVLIIFAIRLIAELAGLA